MSEIIVSTMQGVAKDWRAEAERRRRISRIDPIAETLEWCAGELAERLRAIEHSSEWLTVEDYARQPDVDVTPQTVRTWIRHQRLAAVHGPKGYKIRKGEKVAARRSA